MELEKGKNYLITHSKDDGGYVTQIYVVDVSKTSYNVRDVSACYSGPNWRIKEKWHEQYEIIEKLD